MRDETYEEVRINREQAETGGNIIWPDGRYIDGVFSDCGELGVRGKRGRRSVRTGERRGYGRGRVDRGGCRVLGDHRLACWPFDIGRGLGRRRGGASASAGCAPGTLRVGGLGGGMRDEPQDDVERRIGTYRERLVVVGARVGV